MKKILVVDDEKSLRFTFERFLVEEGYQVETAEDFESASVLLEQTRFAMVFSDIVLGDKTGLDLLRRIRNIDPVCPVVMITGYPNIETASEAVRLGAFDYLPKPVLKKDLQQVARAAVKYREANEKSEVYRTHLEAVFKNVQDGLITVDHEGQVAEFNEAAQRLCGLDGSAAGRSFRDAPAWCQGKCLEALFTTLDKRQPVEIRRLECGHRERPRQVVSLSTAPLMDGSGNFLGAVMVARDETQLDRLERSLKKRSRYHRIYGASEKMQELYSLLDDLADIPSTVLITGESGTGKELVADALHRSGSRANKPLVKVNCAALSDTLLESELFGHVRGSFTGAIKDRIGRFQKADGGTIFLDEIGDISPKMQLRLLRVLQEREIERIGESTPTKVDIRIMAATNCDLAEKVRQGTFREDLYYRLKVIQVAMPPLRKRLDDIPLLVEHFIEKMNITMGRQIQEVSEEVLQLFARYNWPGNIRELEHVMEYAFARCRDAVIACNHLPSDLKDRSVQDPDGESVGEDEEGMILQSLEKTSGNKAKAARLLGIDRKTLYRKMAKLGIEYND
ncbi:MAG: sigma 54-interacting transcriptional regulator [Syntrophotaleaceae bacterium]